MKYLLKFLPFLVIGLMSRVYGQYEDMSKYHIFFKGQPININQIDSLKKLYPKVSFRTDKTKTPPELFIDPYTESDSVKLMERLDSSSKYWTGKPSPLFDVTDVDGRHFSAANLKGNVVVMNFYFTHCSPCLQEIPSLNGIVKDEGHKGVVFLAIALDKKSDLMPFLKSHPFNYNQVADGQHVTDLFGINTWPTNIVVDKNGMIRYFKQGMSEKSIGDIKETIRQLMN